LLVVATLFLAAAAAWAIDIEGTAVVVPVAMHGPGALGTSWRTDLGGAQRHRRRHLHLRHEPEQLTGVEYGAAD
jgi:hypothetical protein